MMGSGFQLLQIFSPIQTKSTLSTEDETPYFPTLGTLLVIAHWSIQHLCVPETFPKCLGVMTHKDPSGGAACTAAWTYFKLFPSLAPS